MLCKIYLILISRLWGVAAANAAITYRDPTSLEFAKTAWEQLDSTYLVRPADVNGTNGVRYNPTRSIPFASSCNGCKQGAFRHATRF